MVQALRKISLLLTFLAVFTAASLVVQPQTIRAQEATPETQLEPEDVTSETFRNLNPLYIGNSEYKTQLSTPRGIISRALTFAFPLGGIILFVMIVWGGFEMLSGAATKKSLDAGRERVTAAIIGFILLFSSYWIVQIVEAVFGVRIL
jgi:hypothetical protein